MRLKRPCEGCWPPTWCRPGPGSPPEPWCTSACRPARDGPGLGAPGHLDRRLPGPGGPPTARSSVGPSDGGAWLDGDAARKVACDAMMIQVVVGDIDPGAIEQLITCCVDPNRVRGYAHLGDPGGSAGTPDGADPEQSRGRPGRPRTPPATPRRAPGQPRRCWPCSSTRSLARRHPDRLGPRRGRLLPPAHPARQGPERAGLPLDVGQTEPTSPSISGGWSRCATRPAAPRRLRPARVRVRSAPRDPPRRRRAHQPVEPEGLLYVARPGDDGPARLGADPCTPTAPARPAARRARSSGATARHPGPGGPPKS